MSYRYSILAAEGPHDQAFLTKLLKMNGFVNKRLMMSTVLHLYPDL